MVGKTLAHYEIIEPLGAGGMGEVYRARDTRLDRDVAIKVLPEDFATDEDRLARFEREAKLLASLNHANIAAIYGLEDEGDQRFIAMELVEGETLAERLSRSGPFEVEEALDIAAQIAEALEAAHASGVIHRDLKPANVIVTVEGKAKVLDFGLAKAYEAAGTTSNVAPDLSHSPTMVGATRAGVILGTAAYMSPEQARGRRVDKRTDIWAFGCVLFEMLAGQTAFGGESVSDTMAAILKEEPDWGALPDLTPHAGNVLRCCLEKDPRDRIRDIGDVRLAMTGTFHLAAKEAGEVSDVRVAPWQRPAVAAVAAAALVAVAALASLLTWIAIGSGPSDEQQTREVSGPLRDASLELPEGAPLVFVGEASGAIGQTSLTISPDGRNIAYVGPAEGATPDENTTRLYVRALDNFDEARPLPGTEGAYGPFFSPDGEWIGFFSGQELKRVSLEGDQVVRIVEANWSYGGSWNEADRIAVVTNDGRGVVVVAFGGGEPEFVELEDRDFIKFTQPSWLPGNDWLLLTCSPAHICALSTRTGEWRHLVPDGPPVRALAEGQLLQGASPRYVDSGHIVYGAPDTNAVRAIRFDPETLATTGQPEVVLQGVRRETSFGALQLAISERGDIVYAPGGDEMEGTFAWVAEGGAIEELPFERKPYGTFHLSSDGRRIAAKVVPAVGPTELWFLDLETEGETRWRDDGTVGDGEVWPGPWIDSARIVANVLSPGASGGTRRVFFEVDADNAIGGEEKGEIEGAWIDDLGSDGSLLVQIDFANPDASHYRLIPREQLHLLSDGTAEGRPLLTGRRPTLGGLSPAVDWITYTTDLRGPYEVWGTRLGSESEPMRISDGPGWNPRWHPQGHGLYYRSGERFYWVPYTASAEQPFGPPRFFLQGTFLQVPGPEYAVSPDGDRLLVLIGTGERTQSTLRLLTNWRAELERRLPR